LLSGRGCPECGKKKIGDALRKSNESFISWLEKVLIYGKEKYAM